MSLTKWLLLVIAVTLCAASAVAFAQSSPQTQALENQVTLTEQLLGQSAAEVSRLRVELAAANAKLNELKAAAPPPPGPALIAKPQSTKEPPK